MQKYKFSAAIQRIRNIVLPAMCALAVSWTATAASIDQLVDQIGLRGGVAFLPRVNNPALPVRLAENSAFIVYAQADQPGTVAEIMRLSLQKGLLSNRIYAGTGAANHLPLAPHSAALVVVDDLSGGKVTDAEIDAWVQALQPVRGVAVLGNEDPSNINLAHLIQRLGKQPGVEAKEASISGYVVCRKAANEGTDCWSHKFRDASNRRESGDTTLDPPFLPAWYALPTNLGYWGDTLVADYSRGYLIWANRSQRTPVSMICFDLRSGARLWERPFSWDKPRDNNYGGYYPGRSCMVAVNDALYFIDEDDIVQLDGETGHELNRLTGLTPGGQIKWIGAENGTLAALGGEADSYHASSLQQLCVNPSGRHLAAYDLNTRKQLWKASEDGEIDEREIAVLDGKLYYHAVGERVACRDLRTGKIHWENLNPETLEMLADRVQPDDKFHNLHVLLISCRGMAATPKALYFASSQLHNRVALDATDGSLLWSAPICKSGRSLPDVIRGDKLYRSLVNRWQSGLFELASNEKIADAKIPGGGCGPSFATPCGFITAFGGVYTFENEALRANDLKSPCDVGVIVSGGVAVSPASICKCPMEIHGFRAFTGYDNTPLTVSTATEQARRHVEKPSPQESPLDWPTYGRHNHRPSSTPVEVPLKTPETRWLWRPEATNPVHLPDIGYGGRYLDKTGHTPCQATAVGDRVYFADHQNVVRAFGLKDGRALWSQPIGSEMMRPPAFHDGRLVAGAMDGFLYCLDASSGEILWKHLVPPSERRIMWYGNLTSTWPLCGGALVEGSLAFGVAGFHSANGLYAAALDLKTGNVVWKVRLPPSADATQSNGSLGGLTAVNGKLFFPSGGMAPAAFDMKTGAASPIPDSPRAARIQRYGMDIAVFDDNWLFYGGRRPYVTIDRWYQDEKTTGYSICRVDMEATQKSHVPFGAVFADATILPPVFDHELIVAASELGRIGYVKPLLRAWDRSSLIKQAEALRTSDKKLAMLTRASMPYDFGTLLKNREPLPGGALWQRDDLPLFAAVLCRNALLAIHPADGDKRKLEDWKLSALDRADGAAIWTVDLPGRPAWNGLSVAPDGAILVALWDGALLALGATAPSDHGQDL